MLVSHAVPHTNGSLYIPARVREWLQLPRRCRLYCRLVDDSSDPSLILSPVPTECWEQCYRVTVYTGDEPGGIFAVLSALQDIQLNILQLLAAATSSAGEIALTAIVTPGPEHEPSEHPDTIAKSIEERIDAYPDLVQHLSQSSLFAEPEAKTRQSPFYLRRVLVKPLLVLRALKLLPPRTNCLGRFIKPQYSQDFTYEMINSKIDLSQPILSGPSDEPLSPFECMQSKHNKGSMSVLITADVHEYHFRVCLLPEKNFVRIKVPLRVAASDVAQLRGLTRTIIAPLAQAPTKLNIFHAASFTTCTNTHAGPLRYTEDVDIRIVGDASGVRRSPRETVTSMLQNAIRKQIESANSTEERRVTERMACGQPDVFDAGITVRPLLAPLVFTATNVKHSMPVTYHAMANELFAELKDLHLRPVFIDTLGGRGPAKDQMIRLLDACPMLVSLHLPEESNRLRSTNRDAGGVRFAASAWTVFEEAYLSSKPGRPVYRLIHRSVFSPPNTDRVLELGFATLPEFRNQLFELRRRIEADRITPEWSDLLRECSSAFENGKLSPEEVAGRDPEAWLKTTVIGHRQGQKIKKRVRAGTLASARSVNGVSKRVKKVASGKSSPRAKEKKTNRAT